MTAHRNRSPDHDPSRRAFLGSTLGTGLLSLASAWQPSAGASDGRARKRSLILLWQDGGPSHFETFDPKPDAPAEYRGELGAIQTSLPGVAYCEVLPRLARLAHRTCVIRSLHHASSDHVVGSHNVLTGWYGETGPSGSRYPDLAAVISRMRSGAEEGKVPIGASTDPNVALGLRKSSPETSPAEQPSLPRYIDIGKGLHRGGPAFLGPHHGPFRVAGDPSKPGFAVQSLGSLDDVQRFAARTALLAGLERSHSRDQARTAGFEQYRATNGIRRQAIELLSGGAAARAFDLSRESPEVRERYGPHLAGQQCLLARRLVEAGAGVVAIRFSPDGRGDYDKTMIGWDDHAVHGNIFEVMRQRGPQFDQSVAALVEDLDERGMRDEVLLVVVGEFGRTPRVHVHKGCPGREHWGAAGCALVYGGGLTMGQVVGATTDKGERPHDRSLSYQSLLATIYHALGINPAHTFLNQAGRPVPILPDGEPIRELTGGPKAENAPRAGPAPPDRIDPYRPALTLPVGATNKALAAVLGRPNLQSLTLHDTRIDDAGLTAVAACRALKRLQLNGTPITDAGLVHVGGLTTLEDLNLTGTRTTDAGLIHLKPLVRLKRLAFNSTAISFAGVIGLFVGGQNRTLVEALAALGLAGFNERGEVVTVHAEDTPFGDDQMRQLGALPSLRELHLAGTRVTDAGMAHVGQFAALERLYLTKCGVGDKGLSHVAGLSHLRAINLVGTNLTSAGLDHLSGLKELRALYVTDVKLGPAAVDQLKSKLPRLTVTDYTPG